MHMTHALGYFGPDPHTPPRERRPSFLLSVGVGVLLGLAALCLLGALAAVTTTTHRRPGDARIAAALTDVANYSTAIDAFAKDTGRYPTEAEGLDALVSPPAGLSAWSGPYLQHLKTDPWGGQYAYHAGGPKGGAGYRIVSKGPDGLAGTDDDIDQGCDAAPPVPSVPPTIRRPATGPCD
jgi:general secretion pathway protein G